MGASDIVTIHYRIMKINDVFKSKMFFWATV